MSAGDYARLAVAWALCGLLAGCFFSIDGSLVNRRVDGASDAVAVEAGLDGTAADSAAEASGDHAALPEAGGDSDSISDTEDMAEDSHR